MEDQEVPDRHKGLLKGSVSGGFFRNFCLRLKVIMDLSSKDRRYGVYFRVYGRCEGVAGLPYVQSQDGPYM